MEKKRLNKIEKLKISLPPWRFHEKLAELKPSEIGEAERFYLKNFGIFGHKLLEDRYVLRVRIPGGRLKSAQLAYFAARIEEQGLRMVLTSRAQLEIHDLSLSQAVAMHEEVEGVGLTTWQTFTDNFRTIVTHPLDGLSTDNEIETFGLLEAMEGVVVKNPEFVGQIPRKFNTAIVGNRTQIASSFGNDLFFALAKKDGRLGFNVYLGGRHAEAARDANLFLSEDLVLPFFETVARFYLEEGPRESRTRARLQHMIQQMGWEAFGDRLMERFEGRGEPRGELLLEKVAPLGIAPLKNGDFAHRYTTRFGEADGAMCREVLETCEAHAIKELRLGVDQNIYIPHLPEKVEFRHASRRYPGILACAGNRYCVYSLTDTKKDAAAMGWGRCERLGISIGFSGCLKGCARNSYSDIGLVGIRTKLFADEVERGVRLYLGALYTRKAVAGRLILYSVPLRHLESMVETVVDLFVLSGYDDFETFAAEVINRYSEPALAFWLLANFDRRQAGLALFVPKAEDIEDEKGYFISLLKHLDDEAARILIPYLHQEEEFDFREAIVYLERKNFSVKSAP